MSRRVCFPGCQCDPCEESRRAVRRRSKLRRMGVHQMLDAEPVVRHLERLLSKGLRQSDICRNSGVSPATVSELLSGRSNRISRRNAQALLSVHPSTKGELVPSVGTIRRARALVAIGWSFGEIEQRAGLCPGYFRMMSFESKQRRSVRVETAEAVKAAYAEMSMTPGPSGRQRSFARNRGWAPPLAWDDDAIDDPAAKPHGLGRDTKILPASFLVSEWEHLRSCGVSIDQAARQLGVKVSAIEKANERVRKGAA